MADGQLHAVVQHIHRLAGAAPDVDLSDRQLLERFAAQRDEASFAELVKRHGSMVLGVCRSVLHDGHAADDVFQAVFLVLARKTAAVRWQESVGSWLHEVAYRLALKARAQAAQRQTRERQVANMRRSDPASEATDQHLRDAVHAELAHLPAKYRAPLVLCYMEGRTNEQAARELACPVGSMSKHLARARDLLRERLTGRGLALAAGLPVATLLAEAASAAVPVKMADAAVRAALVFSSGTPAAAGVVSASAAALADGMARAMFVAQLKRVAFVFLAIGLLSGCGWLTYQTLASPANEGQPTDKRVPVELPADAKAVVLLWDYRHPDLVRRTEEAQVRILADGSLTVHDPYGPGKPIQAKLSARELQDLLQFAVRDQGFFRLEGPIIQEQIRAEQLKRGRTGDGSGLPTTILRIAADGREQELRCTALRQHEETSPETKRLTAIDQRLERLVAWAYAGGQAGVQSALKPANEQLRRQFPEAPLLQEADLQKAVQGADGTLEVTFERRQVGTNQVPFTFVYARVERPTEGEPKVSVRANLGAAAPSSLAASKRAKGPLNLDPPPIAADLSVKYDYPIVYVRVPRVPARSARTGDGQPYWAEAAGPLRMEAGADLMVLHPDGQEELLVAGGKGSVTDPCVSFDGEWVYYSLFHDLTKGRLHPGTAAAADIYKVHVRTRRIVRLTDGGFTPNTGAAVWSDDYRTPQPGKTTMPYPVGNTGPCPLPGGKVMFTSNRNGYISPRSTNSGSNIPLQLFVMDDDGSNVEMIGHLNVGGALHPVVLQDGRVMFSSLENQGQRDTLSWGLWSIHPDGTNWDPIVSSFVSTAFHFQTQLSDGHIVVGAYYGGSGTNGFCTYLKVPVQPLSSYPRFTPGYGPPHDPRNPMTHLESMPFAPIGMRQLTLFADDGDTSALHQTPKELPMVGKVTHPSAAPDNHLLTVWNAHPLHDHAVDAGIYLIKSGGPIHEPGQMLLIKYDARYDAQWPRALVPYKRIHGISEPRYLKPLANDGTLSPHLPEGTPYGLVGSSSLYKRESFPRGLVPKGSVTATWPGKPGTQPRHLDDQENWRFQGAEAGLYANEDIHAVRILVMEPTTDRRNGPKSGRLFRSHAMERLRILAEIPVRKFDGDKQPIDPDGNPDTSFLAKIPADVPWTFQVLDKHGMVLNMAQTWHQVRPGEVRNNCGGCHAHSQQPTPFEQTAAAKPGYPVWDLTKETPLLTSKAHDQSKRKWDTKGDVGLRLVKGVYNVEYLRHVKPILERSCVACHSHKMENPAAGLVLDDDKPIAWAGGHFPQAQMPATYVRLALDNRARSRVKPVIPGDDGGNRMGRYTQVLQSRRSLLIWKVFGRRTDGFNNDDFPTEAVPGDFNTLQLNGNPVPNTSQNRSLSDWHFAGSIMPPPEAVAGSYVGADGGKIKVAPLTDEDRLTLVRWIDLGCPIDLDYDPAKPEERGYGWMLDDNRPTLTLTYPRAGANSALTRILVGMHDYDTGLDLNSFQVVADFPLDGLAAGENLAPKFKAKTDGVWELALTTPLANLPEGKLKVSVKDKQGNVTRIERTFSVVPRAK